MQACSVKMAGYWPSSFFFFFLHFYGPRQSRGSYKIQKKKNKANNPAILTSCLVNNAHILLLDEIKLMVIAHIYLAVRCHLDLVYHLYC